MIRKIKSFKERFLGLTLPSLFEVKLTRLTLLYMIKRGGKFGKKIDHILYRYLFHYPYHIASHIFRRDLSSIKSKDNDKYLFYYENTRAGMDHMQNNLLTLIKDSLNLDRTFVLKNPFFDKEHNFNREILYSWLDYFDLKKTISYKKFTYISHNEFIKKHFSIDEVLVTSEPEISKEDNDKYKVIIRNLVPFSGRQLGRRIKFSSNFKGLFHPSPSVEENGKIVLNRLPKKFCAVHIRNPIHFFSWFLRDKADRLKLSEKLSPENVVKTIKAYNPKNLPIFFMTNTRKINYFKFLNKEFEAYHFLNFENLVDIKKNDNFLLYEIEKFIFLRAEIKIYTFKNDCCINSLSGIQRESNKWERIYQLHTTC